MKKAAITSAPNSHTRNSQSQEHSPNNVQQTMRYGSSGQLGSSFLKKIEFYENPVPFPQGYPAAPPLLSQPPPFIDRPRPPLGGNTSPAFIPPPAIPGVPLGLELLIPLNYVFVKRDVEIVEVISDIETAKRYEVFSPTGQRVYIAAETSLCCPISSRTSVRPFTIQILDFFGRTILMMDRMCDPVLYCCCGSVGGSMTVDLGNGTRLGEIVHKWSYCRPRYDIKDADKKSILQILGPKCGDCCCRRRCCVRNCTFDVITTEGRNVVAFIRNTFAGIVPNSFTDADNFGVEFRGELDVKWKALIFSAVFLIDFMYFQDSARGPSVNVLVDHHEAVAFTRDSSSSTLITVPSGLGFED